MIPGMQILYGLTDLTDLRITMVKIEGFSAWKQTKLSYKTLSSWASWGPLGWQSPFATETGGLFQTGNSVASAEQTSAALILFAYICGNRVTRDPVF